MNAKELKTILKNHLHWINQDCEGWETMRAYLTGADLTGADLIGANLTGAYLNRADLNRAYLIGADLIGADLNGADLIGAKIEKCLVDKFFPLCCPERGSFIAWKKAGDKIVMLEIPENAKRSSAFGRKCRASKAICLAIEDMDGKNSGLTEVHSSYDTDFVYRIGETVEVANYDDDRTHECAPGIHFFITRREAVEY